MFHLSKIVIPKIMNQWEYIAEALYYDLPIIEAIKRREKRILRNVAENFLRTG